MYGSDHKNFGRKNSGLKNPDATEKGTHIPAPQNQNNGGTASVLGLLNMIGDRLIKSEQERQDVRLSLETLENRADMSERIFLTIQDKISKNDSVESDLVRRQENLERIVAESAERFARIETLSTRIEEAIALQNRLARQLERTAQDKAQLLGKIERIEDSVDKTREALTSKALIHLAEQAAIPGWLPSALPANDRRGDDMGPWWKRPYRVQASLVASLLMAGLLGGLALSQLITHWPRNVNAPQVIAQNPPLPNQPPAAPVAAAQAPALSTPAAAPPAPTPALAAVPESPAEVSTAPDDITPYSDEALQKAMDDHPDDVAEALNAITPGVDTGAPANAAPPAAAAPALPSPVDAAPAPANAVAANAVAANAVAANAVAANAVPAKTAAIPDNAMPAVAPSPAQAALAPLPPTVAEKPAAPANLAAKTADGFDADAFIKMQMDRSLPLAQRIKPDASLPPVIKKVEDKAFLGVPEAQHDLAAIYTAGHAGIAVDYKRAVQWFMEAAAGGIANARYNLGVLYHQGLGVDRDIDRAIGWYRTAALLGHPEAEYNLGIATIEGIGIPYDARQAAKYFEQAARGGVMEAAYNLGLIHENGLLGDPDMNEAIYWYKLSSDTSPEAKAALTQTMKSLNIGDSDVDRIVREYSAVYKIPAQRNIGKAAVKTGQAARTQTAPVKQADATDPATLARSMPRLSDEDSQNLLNSIRTTP